jgi:hypothetical protein
MRSLRSPPTVLPLALAVTLAGCASEPASAPGPAAPRPSPTVYFYPLKGQSPAQQDRDRYECYRWAHRQTGFDPSRPVDDDAAVIAYREAMKSCLTARGYSVQ